MALLRSTVIAVALAVGLLATAPAPAADISMANGSVNFSTPDGWLDIMQTDGDPEVRVFQVPDPSPTGHTTLARITVTVKQEPDVNDFHDYMDQATAKAMALPGYQAVAKAPASGSFSYTAREAGVASSYRERYWYRDGLAIQLRCVRPSQSQAGAGWIAAFDRGCDAIAARLQ
ncbi:hypothetical protein ABQJ54_04275 [Rhodanobacter sp. Si-c]|uniref:Uncharacterized protein n=1 Tax=Rhodanobacter lycopersici TaxID=3162487 RepID=A0ABV3QB40_9GAMM